MIREKRGAGYYYAYDLIAKKTNGTDFRQSYYEDEYEEMLVDKETIIRLGYTNVHIVERTWHKNKKRRYGNG